jgi:hypothetical protein
MTTEPVSAAPVVARRRPMSALNVMLGVALLVAVGGVAFAAGRLTSPTTTAAGTRSGNGGQFGGNFGGPNASGAPGGGFGRGGFGGNVSLTGTVTASTPTSLTIALPGGQTVTVATDTATTYHREAAGSAADVTSGKQVIVQVSGRGFGGGGAGAANGSPAPSPGTGGGSQLKATRVTVVP